MIQLRYQVRLPKYEGGGVGLGDWAEVEEMGMTGAVTIFLLTHIYTVMRSQYSVSRTLFLLIYLYHQTYASFYWTMQLLITHYL